jgi:hypothetical protein
MLSYMLFPSTVKRLLAIRSDLRWRFFCRSIAEMHSVPVCFWNNTRSWRILYKIPQYLQHSSAGSVRKQFFTHWRHYTRWNAVRTSQRTFASLGLILECCVLKRFIVGSEYTIRSGSRKFSF